MYVFNGSGWEPIVTPQPSFTAALFYRATANQTVFPTTTPDMNGSSVTLAADGSDGIELFLNGVRLTPDDGSGTRGDYTVAAATSTITLLQGAQANYVLTVDVLVPSSRLAPGAVLSKKLNSITPDGTTTVFTVTAIDATAVTIQNTSELMIHVDGVEQEPGISFTAINNQVTFAVAPSADSIVFMVWLVAGGAGATGIPEAPNDGAIYGRQSLAWQRCAHITKYGSSPNHNPAATGSATYVMMGLAIAITAVQAAAAWVAVDGQILNSANNAQSNCVICFGTGTPPAYGVAQTGTIVSQPARYISTGGGDYVPFSLTALCTGLVNGQDYWFDIALRAPGGGNAQVTDVGLYVHGLA
jgi:hypothetical protein